MDLCGKFMLTSKGRACSNFEEGLHEFEHGCVCACVSPASIGNQPKQGWVQSLNKHGLHNVASVLCGTS